MRILNNLLQLDPTSQQARQIIHESQRAGKSNAKYSRTYNNNNIITFDTETTSLYWKGDKCSFVYISMLCINGHTFYTRNFPDIKLFLDTYDTPGTINVIYVHNLAFDFSFLQNIVPFDTVFARRAHRPIFARYKSWEFRCSYFLSQMSLKNVCKSYKLPARKLVGSPIVGYYNEETGDFEEHNRLLVIKDGKLIMKDTTRPYGFVDLNAKVWFAKYKDKDGVEREYLVTEGYLWTGQYPECKRIVDKGNN